MPAAGDRCLIWWYGDGFNLMSCTLLSREEPQAYKTTSASSSPTRPPNSMPIRFITFLMIESSFTSHLGHLRSPNPGIAGKSWASSDNFAFLASI
jgi:hypothetical protein